MPEVTIAIPSYKRPDDVPAYDYFKDSLIVVPESQKDLYVKNYSHTRIIAIPDEFDGNQPKKRNWILRNMPRPLVMVDDDVRCIVTTEGIYDDNGKFTGRAQQMKKLTPAEAYALIIHGFNLANEWGCVVWGLNVNTDGRNYQQYKPFSLTQIVLGPFYGNLPHRYEYDERFFFKSDYDFCLQVMKGEQKVLRINKYAYYCDHGRAKGGSVAMRTLDKELECARLIMKKWGNQIIRYNVRNPKGYAEVLNGQVHIPLRGV